MVWGSLALITICYVVIYQCFPIAYDDFSYLNSLFNVGADKDGHHNIWIGIRRMFEYHYYTDNARIGNSIGALLELAPRPITAAVSALCASFSLWLMMVLAGVKIYDFKRFCVLCFLFVFALSWNEYMFCHIFAYNYIVILPVFLYAFYIFIYRDKYNVCKAFILGLILGSWHESFGFSLLGSGIVIMLCCPALRVKWRFWMLISTFIGILWLVFCPGTILRIIGSDGKSQVGLIQLYYQWICFVAISSYLISAFNKKWAKVICLSPLSIASIVSSLGLISVAGFTSYPRSAFPAQALCVCMLVRGLPVWFPKFFSSKSLGKAVAMFCLLFIAMVHLIAVAIESVKMKNYTDEMFHALWYKGRQKVVMAPIRYQWEAPLITMDLPDRNYANQAGANFSNLRYYFKDLDLIVVPLELKDYKKGMGDKLGGNNDAYIWRRHIISSNPSDTLHNWRRYVYKYYSNDSPVSYTPFIGADSCVHYYFHQYRSKLGRYMGDPIALRDADF